MSRQPAPYAALASTGRGRRAATATVRDLMLPIERAITVTHSLEDAAGLVIGTEAPVLLLDLSHQPVGLITESALAAMAAQEPERWKRRRCACLVQSPAEFLTPEESIESVLGRYRDGDVKPLLVLEEGQAVGILHQDDVFTWCLEQPVSIFDALGIVSGGSSASERSSSAHGKEVV
ncbi:CBS domain-containing protein [Nesterenkonia sp. Act20]|uniref:CBS domain-containing protein n=1 Tax=Nesterenkonia sp. Act20 TaxID=1483432 RepID=UPI001C46A1B4|nr:CBS domain-containing protein [Nesterenkonia sp. Act20]